MLDKEPDAMHEGLPLPRGWQFILLGADTPRKALRSDGFPGLGVPILDLGLPRLMLAGRTVDFLADIPVGAALRRSSLIEDIVKKEGPSGPMALLTVGHRLVLGDEPVLKETQTYALLAADREHAA
ncbi:FAS1-like dehydratase domain-containing protein [Variovorax sp. ZT4R33]|uniref:FAS1-like dehydratase domain-containing protein n=1 Tax=Variovorax sp. ZT4R33 TaxID=3443743 RepID=UPI003F474774